MISVGLEREINTSESNRNRFIFIIVKIILLLSFILSEDSISPMPKTTNVSSSSRSTKKKTKDPNAPKRFRTAYLLFSNEKREEVKVNLYLIQLIMIISMNL